MKKMSPSSSSSGSTMSKILTMTIVEKVQRISEQVTNTLALRKKMQDGAAES